MVGCRATTYDHVNFRCTYQGSNCSGITENKNTTFIQRYCSSGAQMQNYTQICHNCGIGPDCQGKFNFQDGVRLDYKCVAICEGSIDCKAVHYFTLSSDSLCDMYQCGQVTQMIGHTVYRKATHSDCLQYEIFTHDGERGNCSVIGTDKMATGPEFCLERCLELEYCRGSTYHEETNVCEHHSCDDHVIDSNSTFMKRVCESSYLPCTRNNTQICINCRRGPNCPPYFNAYLESKPRNINISMLGVDPDLKMLWYHPEMSLVKSVQCSYVDLRIGNIVHRATCSQEKDCRKFEMFILYDHMGTCDVIGSIDGGLSLHYCIDKCLDMDGCRGTTFDTMQLRCDFHSCDNYRTGGNFVFMRRACINEYNECIANVTQTCLDCTMGPNCQMPYETISNVYHTKDCLDIKAADTETEAALYHRQTSTCEKYQCSQVDLAIGSVVHRESCSTDCPKYEIFIQKNYAGTCDVIAFDEGGVNLHYCIEKCLDMPGCRGTTFDRNLLRCDYHDCTNKTTSRGVTFMKRRCIEEDHCIRNYTQTCLNCGKGPTCPDSFHKQTSVHLWQTCQEQASTFAAADMVTYNPLTATCDFIECTEVQQQEFMKTFRRSCSSDCRKYSIFTINGYQGTCNVIGSDEGGVTLNYCMEKCLDMDGCRGVSYETLTLRCDYHECDTRTKNSEYTFLKRVCDDGTEQVKNYIQTCINCVNTCTPMSLQTGVTDSTLCNTMCANCDSVYYDSSANTCHQSQCDIQYPVNGSLSTVFRKSHNPVCLKYELLVKTNQETKCKTTGYDEGVENSIYCNMKCMDNSACMATMYNTLTDTCTYHECAESTDMDNSTTGDTNYFFQKKCIDSATGVVVANNNNKRGSIKTWSVYNRICSNSAEVVGVVTTPPQKRIYLRPCICSTGAFANMTTEEIVEQLITNLTIDVTHTSSARRRKTSAPDRRPSSQFIGSLGTIVIILVVSVVLVMDVIRIVPIVKTLVKRLLNPTPSPIRATVIVPEDMNNDNEMKEVPEATCIPDGIKTSDEVNELPDANCSLEIINNDDKIKEKAEAASSLKYINNDNKVMELHGHCSDLTVTVL